MRARRARPCLATLGPYGRSLYRVLTRASCPLRRSAATSLAKAPESPFEFAEPLQCAFRTAPLLDPAKIDAVSSRDQHRGAETLTVIPVVKRRKPVAARIGRRQGERLGRSRSHEHGSYFMITPDCHRSGRKLDVEDDRRVRVSVALPAEPELSKRFINLVLPRRPLNDEIDVLGHVRTPGMQARRRASRQHGSHTSATQRVADRYGDMRKRRPPRKLHRALPAGRGLRRRDSIRRVNSSSASARRAR